MGRGEGDHAATPIPTDARMPLPPPCRSMAATSMAALAASEGPALFMDTKKEDRAKKVGQGCCWLG